MIVVFTESRGISNIMGSRNDYEELFPRIADKGTER